jgi:hypothetical protein
MTDTVAVNAEQDAVVVPSVGGASLAPRLRQDARPVGVAVGPKPRLWK